MATTSESVAFDLIEQLFDISDDIRYVAVLRDGKLDMSVRGGLADASAPESDRYEELLVNPTLLLLTRQRGDIDCGGCRWVLVRYGNFYQLVLPIAGGHVSVCIDQSADPIALGTVIEQHLHAEA